MTKASVKPAPLLRTTRETVEVGLDHLTARSVVTLDGEEADLLEVNYPWGNLASAHPPQATKVLDLRGFHLDLPRERRIGLGDITIQADLDSETFRLVDRAGRPLVPVHVCSMRDIGLPSLLRFLLAFGPGETRGVFPFPHSEGDENLRLTCGNLVLRRRRWTILIDGLRDDLKGLADSQVYARVYGWRRRLGLPSQGFYYECTYHGAFKPQYVDFDSPSLCGLFAASLQRREAEYLSIEEALPSPADFPCDAQTGRRGLEIMIDSLTIRADGGNLSAGAQDDDRESTSLRKES